MGIAFNRPCPQQNTKKRRRILHFGVAARHTARLWVSFSLENLGKYNFFRQLWLVLGIKLMEINSNLFSRYGVPTAQNLTTSDFCGFSVQGLVLPCKGPRSSGFGRESCLAPIWGRKKKCFWVIAQKFEPSIKTEKKTIDHTFILPSRQTWSYSEISTCQPCPSHPSQPLNSFALCKVKKWYTKCFHGFFPKSLAILNSSWPFWDGEFTWPELKAESWPPRFGDKKVTLIESSGGGENFWSQRFEKRVLPQKTHAFIWTS